MEILLIRTGVEEQEEATMARFMHGLKLEVRDRVDMVEYNGLQGLLHHAIRAEQQVKRRAGHDNSSNSMRRNFQREGGDNSGFKSDSKSATKEVSPSKVESSRASNSRTSNIVCFKCGGRVHKKFECPNERRILLRRRIHVCE